MSDAVMVQADGVDELHGALCRANLGIFATTALAPLRPARHHRLLIQRLQHAARTPGARLMVAMPPGSAKSTYSSRVLPAWALAVPGINVIGASHTMTLAQAFSGRVQDMIRENMPTLGYGLLTEAKDRWQTTNGGEYLASGVGSGIAGFRADLAIIDDPVKSRKDADSETYREAAWNWYHADLARRLKPGASVVIIMTRWHEDDLAGRLLATNKGGWEVLSLPAFAVENDQLGREPGEPLWSDDGYGFGAELAGIKRDLETAGQTREWSALYQQNPRPADGSIFRTAQIEVLDTEPPLFGAHIGAGWDLAATRQHGTRDPDWTVRVKMARLPSGRYVVLDVFRDRGGPDQVDGWLNNVTRQDGHKVKVSVPQDPGQAGKAQVLSIVRLLSGFTVESSVETGDKATRAAPFASQVNVGNVAMVRGAWNAAFLDELAAFPSGAKDDQVDAASRAFSVVGLGARPLIVSPDVLKALGQR